MVSLKARDREDDDIQLYELVEVWQWEMMDTEHHHIHHTSITEPSDVYKAARGDF